MIGDELGNDARPLAGEVRTWTSNQGATRVAFGLLEGAAASMLVLLPAFFYQVVLLHGATSLPLHALLSALVGVIYGAASANTAARFFDRTGSRVTRLADAAMGWTAAFGVALLAAFLAGLADDLSRVSILAAYLVGLPVLLALRSLAYAGVEASMRAGRMHFRKVAVIGDADDVGRFLAGGTLPRSGSAMVGTLYLDAVRGADGTLRPGAVSTFAAVAVANGADHVLFVGDLADSAAIERIVGELKRFAIDLAVAPATPSTAFTFIDTVAIGPNNAIRLLRKPMSAGGVFLKRALDLCGAGFGLLMLSPLFAVVALLIKLTSKGPVFYLQARRGFNGEVFRIWKFRSMRVTESGHAMTRQAERNDPRITPIGRFIRSSSIDELPQLINVLFGEMSLVGPRPHAVSHDDELGRQVETYAHRQRIKPGITGWAQVNGFRGELKTLAQIEGRTRYDLAYIDGWSIFLDCWILLLTVFSAKTHSNVF